MNNKKECFLCDVHIADAINYSEEGLSFDINCDNCGHYIVHYDLIAQIQTTYKDKRYILSGIIRENTEARRKPVDFSKISIDNLIRNSPYPSDLFEKLDKLLIHIFKESDYSGDFVHIKENHYALAFAKNTEEFKFILAKLIDLNHIENPDKNKYRLTLDGWKRAYELKKTIRKSNQCFVAMWFDDSMNIFKEEVANALKEAGYDKLIMDEMEHNDKICDRIIAEIRKSSLMVADFTGHRGNVYYEAGFAKGLDIPVIFTCKDSDFKNLQFDTRQYNHIKWSDSNDLCEKLKHRIEATVLHKHTE